MASFPPGGHRRRGGPGGAAGGRRPPRPSRCLPAVTDAAATGGAGARGRGAHFRGGAPRMRRRRPGSLDGRGKAEARTAVSGCGVEVPWRDARRRETAGTGPASGEGRATPRRRSRTTRGGPRPRRSGCPSTRTGWTSGCSCWWTWCCSWSSTCGRGERGARGPPGPAGLGKGCGNLSCVSLGCSATKPRSVCSRPEDAEVVELRGALGVYRGGPEWPGPASAAGPKGRDLSAARSLRGPQAPVTALQLDQEPAAQVSRVPDVLISQSCHFSNVSLPPRTRPDTPNTGGQFTLLGGFHLQVHFPSRSLGRQFWQRGRKEREGKGRRGERRRTESGVGGVGRGGVQWSREAGSGGGAYGRRDQTPPGLWSSLFP